MKQLLTALAAAAAGATAMYFLDPDTGRRRRAVVRDRTVSVAVDAGEFARAQGRHASNQVRGLAAAARSKLHGQAKPGDRKLQERVRSCLGRVVSHPHAIDVDVSDGEVRLFGDVLQRELEAMLSEIRSLHGVSNVVNQLIAHQEADGVPQLQNNDGRANGQRRLRAIVPIVAIAAPIALIVAASARPAMASRHLPWRSGNPLRQFTPWNRHASVGTRARRYVQQWLPH